MPEIKPKAKRGRPRKIQQPNTNIKESQDFIQERLVRCEDNIDRIIQVVDDLRWKGRGDVRWLKFRHPILSWKIHRDVKKRNTYKV